MDIQKNIIDWLKTLKGWQTELAYRVLTKEIEETDVIDIIAMVKSNANFENKCFPNIVRHCPRFCVNRKLEDSSFILESCGTVHDFV